jgi:hypothetical protein
MVDSGNQRLTPPIQIKNYEYLNPSTPKIGLKKSTSGLSSHLGEDGNKSENSFTTIATKRRFEELTPSFKAKSPCVARIKKGSRKDLITIDLSKSKVSASQINRYAKNAVMAPIGQDKKLSTKKSPRTGGVVLNSSTTKFDGKDGKDSKIATSKPSSSKPKVVDDRKFSIMDIPGNIVSIHSSKSYFTI